ISVLMKTKQTKLANTLAEKLYIDFKAGIFKEYRNECVTCMYKLLTAIHEQNGEIDLAILYANKSVRAADELIDYISLYKKIAENLEKKLYIYFKEGIFKEYRNECVTCMYKLLTAIHEQNGEIDLAILYANKSVRAADELIDYISLYKKIAELYAQKNEFKK